MKRLLFLLAISLAAVSLICFAEPAWAFCGFYVAKADANLYNQASQVIIAKDGDRTVLTMTNDYQGDVEDFALVVPVPVVLQEDQVRVGNPKIIQRLDNFSAPRLVEYFDSNPCQVYRSKQPAVLEQESATSDENRELKRDETLGVTVEQQFTVGEYDIVILSAKESNGLEIWLRQNGYKIPQGASRLLQPYIRQNMNFFVAKVNLKEYDSKGFSSLRPLMMAYESPKFMLPIRLGMINAKNAQDLIVYLLSPRGQSELTNYRTVKVPSNVDIPEFVEQKFNDFYKAMFQTAYEQENKKVAFIEYAWNMASCDPCSAQPLNRDELRQAGVFWLNSSSRQNVFITRLHVRYTRSTFPEDLYFQETSNRQFFQGRYVIRHPYRGEINCGSAQEYQQSVRQRQEREAQTLAKLTGWNLNDIRSKINFVENKPVPWWHRLWN